MQNGTRDGFAALPPLRLPPPGRARRWPALTGAALALALLGCEAPQQVAPTGAAAPAATPPRAGSAEALAGALPAQAGAFARGATVPVRQPMEGLEVNYATPNRRGAAFVQVVRPAEGGAQGGAPAVAVSEYARWLAEVSTGARPGRRLTLVQEFAEPAGPGLRCAALEGRYGREPVQSTLCVGASGGHVLRLRVSSIRDAVPAAEARSFMTEVAQALPRG